MSDRFVQPEDLGNEFVFDDGEERWHVKVDGGITRRPDGSIVIDPAFITSLVPAAQPGEGGDGGQHRTIGGGFDKSNEMLSLNIADGEQISWKLDGVVTDAKLESRLDVGTVPIRNSAGKPTGLEAFVDTAAPPAA